MARCLLAIQQQILHGHIAEASWDGFETHLDSVLRALALLRHGRLKARGVDAHTFLRSNLRRDLQREAVRVVQQEGPVAGHLQPLTVLRRARLRPDVLQRQAQAVSGILRVEALGFSPWQLVAGRQAAAALQMECACFGIYLAEMRRRQSLQKPAEPS